jgi:Mce-associated membrane protein
LIGWLRTAWAWVRRWLPWLVAGVALAIAAVFAYLWWQHKSEDNARREIEEIATEFTHALTDFSAETIESDVREIKSFAVGSFSDEVDTFFGDETVAAVKEAEATSDGDIEGLYVQRIGEASASVFVLVSETVTNASLTEPQTDTLRIEVDLIETTQGWKVESVQILQAPGGGLLGGTGTG